MFWWNSDFYVMIWFIIQLKQWMFWGQGDRLEVFVGVLWSYIIARWFLNSLGETKWDCKYLMMYRVFYFSLLSLVQVLVQVLPSRELTYSQKWHFEDDFPSPKVGYVNSLDYYFYYYHHHYHHYHHHHQHEANQGMAQSPFWRLKLGVVDLDDFNWWLILVVWGPVVWDSRVSLRNNPFHTKPPVYN